MKKCLDGSVLKMSFLSRTKSNLLLWECGCSFISYYHNPAMFLAKSKYRSLIWLGDGGESHFQIIVQYASLYASFRLRMNSCTASVAFLCSGHSFASGVDSIASPKCFLTVLNRYFSHSAIFSLAIAFQTSSQMDTL